MWWRVMWMWPVQNKSGVSGGVVGPVDAAGHGVACKWASGPVDAGVVEYEVLLASRQGPVDTVSGKQEQMYCVRGSAGREVQRGARWRGANWVVVKPMLVTGGWLWLRGNHMQDEVDMGVVIKGRL